MSNAPASVIAMEPNMEFEAQDDPLQRSQADHEFDLIRELVEIGVPMGWIDYSGFNTEYVEL